MRKTIFSSETPNEVTSFLLLSKGGKKMHDCCYKHIEFDREEQGVMIYRCPVCKTEFAVYERE